VNDKKLFRKIKNGILRSCKQLTYRRKCRLYCVGAAKTGTHSIDSMFDRTVRSAHEPDRTEIIGKIIDILEGRINKSEIVSYIRERDARLCLDVDSSQLNFFLLDYLLEEFPASLYLLTIRDCYSWLDSFINDSLRRSTNEHWIKLRQYRFQANEFSHPPEEQPLKERGLYTLDGYLSYWASHNSRVLSSVPEDRLMVVKTNEITKRASEIADFAGLPRTSIKLEQSHSFRNPTKFNVLKEIQETYLEKKVEKHCGVLMKRFFPEITSIHDSNI
jgi:hypothetical protein